MNKNHSDFKKIILVVVVLLILLIGLVMVRGSKKTTLNNTLNNTLNRTGDKKPAATATKVPLIGKYLFPENSKTVRAGQKVSLVIEFSAPGKILTGADAFLIYDPKYMQIDSVTQAGYFTRYPRKVIDNKTGTLKITAFMSRDQNKITNNVPLATVNFTALKAGKTQVKFDFISGSDNRSTLVEKGTSKNILGSVGMANIVISP